MNVEKQHTKPPEKVFHSMEEIRKHFFPNFYEEEERRNRTSRDRCDRLNKRHLGTGANASFANEPNVKIRILLSLQRWAALPSFSKVKLACRIGFGNMISNGMGMPLTDIVKTPTAHIPSPHINDTALTPKENHLWHETTAPPNPPKSKTTATTTPPEETTRPPPSLPKADSAKHQRQEYAYNPHLPPVLRFDDSGDADQTPRTPRKGKERTLRRRNQNPRKCFERPRTVARMGGQTRGEILRRRSGGVAHPRALERKSHLENRGAPRCPTRFLR